MNLTTLFNAKSVRETFRVEPLGRPRETLRPVRRTPPRARRGFFRGAEPTTFHRCLAVHMHFAAHSGALD